MFKFILTSLALATVGGYGLGYLLTFLGITGVIASTIIGAYLGLAVAAFYMLPAWGGVVAKSVINSGTSKVS